jgi:hypothetical protein
MNTIAGILMLAITLLPAAAAFSQQSPIVHDSTAKTVTLATADGGLSLQLAYDRGCSVNHMKVRGLAVGGRVAFTGIQVGGKVFTSEMNERQPVVKLTGNSITVDSIRFGGP